MHYQEQSCARQKLDETDTERCTGHDGLGRFVWHSVAMVDLELKLAKMVTADREEAGPSWPGTVMEQILEVERR